MFTKQQLNILIDAQSGDDWTPNYFIERLPEVGEQSDISGAEFDELMAILERYTYEQVADLQIALTILESLRLLP